MRGCARPARLAALILLALAQTAPAFAQDAKRDLPAAAFDQPATTWFDPGACAAPGGPLHLAVGRSVLAVPADRVRSLLPGRIAAPGQTPPPPAMVQIARQAGCASDPLPTATAYLLGVDVAGGSILVSETPANAAAFDAQLARIRDAGSCQATGSDFVLCVGSREGASGQQSVAYLIARDASERQMSGGPLRALCRPNGACSIVDDLDGGLRFQLPLPERPSLASLRAADSAGRRLVEGLRVK